MYFAHPEKGVSKVRGDIKRGLIETRDYSKTHSPFISYVGGRKFLQGDKISRVQREGGIN